MKKARYTSVLVILILLASLVQWPMGEAIIPQQQTIWIEDTRDDAFITESGNLIDTYLCHITDPNMDIISFLVFRELDINGWEPLTNATLRFRTTVNLDFEADSSVTIYGMKIKNLQDEGILRPSFVLSVPYTSASVPMNTSDFYGQQWHEVDVTSIIQELKSHIHWDGHGRSADETGDDVGFVIIGRRGYDTRWFIDYHYGTPSLATHLVIHWNHEFSPPSDPPGDVEPEFVQTYGNNYTIWLVPVGPDYLFTNGTESPYDIIYDYVGNVDDPVSIAQSDRSSATATNCKRLLVHLSDGIIYATYIRKLGDFSQIYVEKGIDNGATWINETRISTYAGMEENTQSMECLAVDSNDNLHAVWSGKAEGYTTNEAIWYTKYDGSWSAPIVLSTHATTDYQQISPAIAVDSNDNLHVSWVGQTNIYANHQIWYRKYTASWGATTRISTYAGMDTNLQSGDPTIAVDSNNYIHVLWPGKANGFTTNSQIWHNKYMVSWASPVRISTYGGMDENTQFRPCIAIDSNDYLHAVWYGKANGFTTNSQIWHNKYMVSWASPVRISTYDEMDDYTQDGPSIAVDSDNYLHVLFHGKATGYTDYDKVWYARYNVSWALYGLQLIGQSAWPNIMWYRWPTLEYRNDTYFITDLNGTIVLDNGDPLIFDDVDDAIDWIDTYDPDPLDPDPPGWPTEGPFIRFKIRLYFLAIGFGCLFGPLLFFAWRRPSGYYILCGAILMLMGIGMLLSIGQV
ncbi:hypothetical protein ES703_09508 [subsurface metagenome]